METDVQVSNRQRDIAQAARHVLTVLLMLLLSGGARYLPGADLYLFGRVSVVVALHFGIALAAVVLLLNVHGSVFRVTCHYLEALVARSGKAPDAAPSVSKAAGGIVVLLYILVLYSVFMRAFRPLLGSLTASQRPFQIIDACCLVTALVALVRTVTGAHGLFDKVGEALAERATTPSLRTTIKCSACGAIDETQGRYCRACGSALAGTTEDMTAVEPPSTCGRCGATVRPSARFCQACGKPV